MEDFQDLKNKGFKYHQENNLDNAERCYKKALKINSKNAEAHNLLGLVKLQQNNFEEAIDWIKKAIDIEKNAYFYETLFQALAIQEKYSEIINYENEITEYLEKEFSLNFYLALAYKNLNEIKKSIYYYEKATKLNPNSYDSWFNLSHLYSIEGETFKALEALKVCKNLNPEDSETEYFLSLAYMRVKDYDNGLNYFEKRFCKEIAFLTQNKTFPTKATRENLWHGEDIKDKSILVYYEAGFGDVIMFARYLPILKERCKKIILHIQKPLKALFEENPQLGVDEIIDGFVPEKEIDFDTHVPMLSLPYLLNLKGNEVFTGHEGYVKPNAEKVEEYKKKYFDNDKIKIGIKWQGNTYYDKDRVIPTEAFYPLIEMANTQFYSFQTEEGSEEVKKLTDKYNVVDIGKDLKDFAITSATLSNLDLVICNDTSLAHLAGALNIPCYILLPYEVNWRWHTDLNKCDWYDSVKLFRQKSIGDWKDIFQEVLKVVNRHKRARNDNSFNN